MPNKFDTNVTPWLFIPHNEGELDEYFSADHTKAVADTSRKIIESLSESHDRLSGKVCYEFGYNQRKYKLTLLRFADIIIRADVTIKRIKSEFMKSELENRELRARIKELEREIEDEHTTV